LEGKNDDLTAVTFQPESLTTGSLAILTATDDVPLGAALSKYSDEHGIGVIPERRTFPEAGGLR
jgi:hypothetical protein